MRKESPMLYRKLGKTGCEVSILGFGCMRLPMKGGTQSSADRFDPKKLIDEELALQLIHYAMSKGINYFDTAYPYHSGKSETVLGRAIKGTRDKIMLATKLPTWQVNKQEDPDRFLDEQLLKLGTDHLDVYLLHGIDRQSWVKLKELKVLRFLDRIRARGLARFVGFSFHDDVTTFKEIVDSYDWALCQIQYNYFDEHYQAGKEGLTYAASKGLGVVVMEPLRGGKLTERMPEEVRALLESAEEKRTPAEWALRWVWNHPEVSTALSGMSTMAQVKENIQLADEGRPNSLSVKELSLIDHVKKVYEGLLKIHCTSCAYCMPCKSGVNIPGNFSLYNDLFMFKDAEQIARIYNQLLSPEQKASNCTECAECEEHCPQHLKIMEGLKAVHQALSRPNLAD